MGIVCKNHVFTLQTKSSTYQMKEEGGFLFHNYYGPVIGDVDMSYLVALWTEVFPDSLRKLWTGVFHWIPDF